MDSTAPTQEAEKTMPAKVPTKNNSWSAIISIIIILAMVIIGAFYSWGQRISEQHANRAADHQDNSSNQ